jgi:aspartyl-tRNA(Asn)/glutamyl-tRNA(Gln) amidotransferase subunit A
VAILALVAFDTGGPVSSAPRLSGRLLKSLAALAKTRAGSALIYRITRGDLRIDELPRLAPHHFGDVPLDNHAVAGRPPRRVESAHLALPAPPWSGTSATRTAAYASGETTPVAAVRHALEAARALAARRPGVGPMLDFCETVALREADASAGRWQRGGALGPFDGVPVLVKEQTSVAGMPARAGSDLTDATPAARDATCVARLRAAGAIVLGTTPMTEFGMTPLGFNPKRVMPRNPHGAGHVAGGSSTGSGVAVATGLVPMALGGDGGGSIRIPSALCGVFGIKPTWGRVSRHGDVLSGTVGHLGPLASSTLDLARSLEIMSGPDPDDAQTAAGPAITPGEFTSALGRGVRGMRIGVEAGEWRDTAPAIASAGQEALRALERTGAVLVDVRIELARHAASIGYLAIGLEALAMSWAWLTSGAAFNPDLAVSHAALGRATAIEAVQAQRLRTGLRRELARVMGDVDLLALPTTATTAAAVTDGEFDGGFIDPGAIDAMCRFNFLGNLTGLPALNAPVGLDAASMPIGLQLVGDAWDEATVLAASAHLERIGAAYVARPSVHV